jgi:hypothetical protein
MDWTSEGLPFSPHWARTARVAAGTRVGSKVRFDGEVTEYEPGQDTLDALLSLQGDLHPDKPSAGAIAFFEQYGPLGLYFQGLRSNTVFESFFKDHYVWCVNSWPGHQPLREYWGEFHSRNFSNTLDPEQLCRADIFSHGYFEHWYSIWLDLRDLLETAYVLARLQEQALLQDDLTYINELLSGSLRPALRRRDGKLEWSFAFNSLYDALLVLMVQRAIGGGLHTCQPCGRVFTSIRRKYCSDECMLAAQESKRRGSELLREKRRLRELLKTRTEKHGLPPEKGNEIRLAVNEAPDIATLKTVEERYEAVFTRHKRGAQTEGRA